LLCVKHAIKNLGTIKQQTKRKKQPALCSITALAVWHWHCDQPVQLKSNYIKQQSTSSLYQTCTSIATKGQTKQSALYSIVGWLSAMLCLHQLHRHFRLWCWCARNPGVCLVQADNGRWQTRHSVQLFSVHSSLMGPRLAMSKQLLYMLLHKWIQKQLSCLHHKTIIRLLHIQWFDEPCWVMSQTGYVLTLVAVPWLGCQGSRVQQGRVYCLVTSHACQTYFQQEHDYLRRLVYLFVLYMMQVLEDVATC